MRCYVGVLCTLSVLFAISHAAPANVDLSVSASGSQATDPTAILTQLSDKFSRSIQLLRRICPPIFQVIDGVVQNVTSQIFRVVGRVVLRSGIGGGLGGGGESMVSVVLPTFPPDDDEEDESTETVEVSSSASIESSSLDESFVRISDSTTAKAQELALSINEISPENENEQTLYTAISTDVDSDISESEIRDKSIDAIFKGIVEIENEIESSTSNTESVVPTDPIPPNTPSEDINFSIKVLQEGNIVNTIPVVEMSPSSETRAKRVVREAEAESNDQDAAASGGNGPDPEEDLSDVEEGERDKRYSPFGVSGDVHASGGGSGNFLFDIIRLIAGSGATEETDEKENGAVGAGGVAEIDVGKTADGYTEGIPGPITRLFVIANRGLANLVQDLILRLAQTSERIVNFKARLITALI